VPGEATVSALYQSVIFKGPLVRAILAGTKTQTRRLMKPQPYSNGRWDRDAQDLVCHNDYLPPSALLLDVGRGKNAFTTSDQEEGDEGLARHCPYGRVGDRLWVRETWRPQPATDRGYTPDSGDVWVTYAADGCERLFGDAVIGDAWTMPMAAARGNVPPIHMPRWASRLTLEITSVRVERLQSISEEDARAEGIAHTPFSAIGAQSGYGPSMRTTAVQAFAELWDEINGKRAPWSSNPWVWAISFRKVTT
jgi:hypothetical protein